MIHRARNRHLHGYAPAGLPAAPAGLIGLLNLLNSVAGLVRS
jgi:hypothetical protein